MKALKILLALALVVVMGAALVSCDINPMTIWQEKSHRFSMSMRS